MEDLIGSDEISPSVILLLLLLLLLLLFPLEFAGNVCGSIASEEPRSFIKSADADRRRFFATGGVGAAQPARQRSGHFQIGHFQGSQFTIPYICQLDTERWRDREGRETAEEKDR